MKTKRMYISNKNNIKGFTLLELLLVLALIAVVASSIMTFFISYVKANRAISTRTELQYNAREIGSFISDKVMQSTGIIYLSDIASPEVNVTNTTEPVNIKSICFGRADSGYDSFTILDNKIYYERTTEDSQLAEVNSNNLLSNNVKGIVISVKDSKDYLDTKYIELKIELSRDSEEYSITQVICLRNKQRS